MKILITNKKEVESFFDEIKDSKYKTSAEIHKLLFNKVNLDFSTQNKIEITVLIPYSEIIEGDCVFTFVGKNKDLFFYDFNGTVK